MNIGIIVIRELRMLSRRRLLYGMRMVFLGLIFLTWFLPFISALDGEGILITVTFVSMVIFGIGASVTTSDSISSERREKTLGLLMLTPLRPIAVMTGKLITGISQYLLCLFAVTPIIALPLLSGGVTWDDVMKCCLAIWTMTFLGLTVGFFWTTIFQDLKTSSTASFLTMLGLYFYPFIFLLANLFPGVRINDTIITLGPLFTLATYSVVDLLSAKYFEAVATIFGAGATLLLAAYIAFRIVWKKETNPQSIELIKNPGDKLNRLRIKRSGKLRWYQFSWQDNPYRGWVMANAKKQPIIEGIAKLTWGWIILISGILLLFKTGIAMCCLGLGFLELLNRWAAAIEAPRQIVHDRKSGMLELLLVSPVNDKSLISGLLSELKKHQTRRSFLLAIGYACFLSGITIGILTEPFSGIMIGNLFVPVAVVANHTVIILFSVFSIGNVLLSFKELQTTQTYGVWLAMRLSKHLAITWLLFAINFLIPLFLLPLSFWINGLVYITFFLGEAPGIDVSGIIGIFSLITWLLVWFLIRFILAWSLGYYASKQFRDMRKTIC